MAAARHQFLCLQFYPGGLTRTADRPRLTDEGPVSSARLLSGPLPRRCRRRGSSSPQWTTRPPRPHSRQPSSGPRSADRGLRRARARRSGGLGRQGSASVPRLPRPRRPQRSNVVTEVLDALESSGARILPTFPYAPSRPRPPAGRSPITPEPSTWQRGRPVRQDGHAALSDLPSVEPADRGRVIELARATL